MHTDLSVKDTLTLQIINHSDDSIVDDFVSGSGIDQVIWFEPEDAQTLIGELLESNFQKFVNDVRIDGQAIRLK
jgi:polyhydroxyalkanoate synthesis regulator protein